MAQPDPLAVRVDHVNIRVDDPAPLFSVLTERLRLPALWPPAAMPGFGIAGVGVGNVHIEPTRYGSGRSRRGRGADLFSICLEPAPVEAASAELTRRGIPHTPPVPYIGDFPREAETDIFHRIESSRGRDQLWTWIFMGGFLGDRAMARQYSSPLFRSSGMARRLGSISGRQRLGAALTSVTAPRRPYPFFCEWNAFDIAAIRARALEELRRREGGTLGVVRMKEIVVGARDPDSEIDRWQRLFDPTHRTADGVWQLGDGPGIRLLADTEDRIQALAWEVASREDAERALDKESMLGPVTDECVTIAPHAVHGLDIRLVEDQVVRG